VSIKVDDWGYYSKLDEAGAAAAAAEAAGYDAWFATETQIDAMLGCAVGAERTSEIGIGTAISVAFARNPMTVAMQANDIQVLSGGRFILGLGSQIKPHITKRFSMPWSHPAPRMREFILAIRAIWDSWAGDGTLDFQGDFYSHTLMTPFFNPGPHDFGAPPVYLAGVGPLMTQVAGEVADGILCHGFTTERYVREKTLPAVRAGREKAGKTMEGFEINMPLMCVARDTEEERTQGAAFVRQQIGFYGSTPAYRPVLELHGWGPLQDELNALSKAGKWDQMADAIPDEVFDEFAIVDTPEAAFAEIKRRFGDVATRITVSIPEDADRDRWSELFAGLRAQPRT
jgi:probable F420-dependent oxidoreductase